MKREGKKWNNRISGKPLLETVFFVENWFFWSKKWRNENNREYENKNENRNISTSFKERIGIEVGMWMSSQWKWWREKKAKKDE